MESAIVEQDSRETTKDQVIKLMLGAAAGFLATRMIENGYDKLVIQRRPVLKTSTLDQ